MKSFDFVIRKKEAMDVYTHWMKTFNRDVCCETCDSIRKDDDGKMWCGVFDKYKDVIDIDMIEVNPGNVCSYHQQYRINCERCDNCKCDCDYYG